MQSETIGLVLAAVAIVLLTVIWTTLLARGVWHVLRQLRPQVEVLLALAVVAGWLRARPPAARRLASPIS